MIQEYQRVCAKIPELFETLMAPHCQKVDALIEPGLTYLNWSSLNIGSFIQSVHAGLDDLELLIDRACDIRTYRIENVLKDMSCVPLCELPDNEPWTIQDFVNNSKVWFTEDSVCILYCILGIMEVCTFSQKLLTEISLNTFMVPWQCVLNSTVILFKKTQAAGYGIFRQLLSKLEIDLPYLLTYCMTTVISLEIKQTSPGPPFYTAITNFVPFEVCSLCTFLCFIWLFFIHATKLGENMSE